MNIIFVLVVCLILSVPCHAENWSKIDTALEIVSEATFVADWSITLDALNHDDAYCVNPLQGGDNPDRAKINLWFTSMLILHPIISYILPTEYSYIDDGKERSANLRRIFQVLTISLNTAFVLHNLAVGYKFTF